MTDIFFKNTAFFQTSFLLPRSVTLSQLRDAVNTLLEKRFRVLLSTIDAKHGILRENESSTSLPLYVVSGETLDDVHTQVCHDAETRVDMACQLYYAEDGKKNVYLIVNAHHGVADGTLITAFARSLYAVLNEKPLPEMPDFVFYDPTKRPELLEFPASVYSSNKESVMKWCEECAKSIPSPSVNPLKSRDVSDRFYTRQRVINKEATSRSVSFAKCCGELYKENGCIHGMLLHAYLRALIFTDGLPPSGTIAIDTIVNMRRYLKSKSIRSLVSSSIEDTQPSIFFSSFPTAFSVEKLVQGELNPALIQHSVTEGLNNGLPLALLFLDPSRAHPTLKENQLFLEVSNLGMHPKDCFPRQLVSQIAYTGHPNAITVVVWTDLEGCFHLCCSAFSGCIDEVRMDKFLDEFAHQLFDCGVVLPVCSTRHFTFLFPLLDSMSKESARLITTTLITRMSPFRMSGFFASPWMTTMKRTRA